MSEKSALQPPSIVTEEPSELGTYADSLPAAGSPKESDNVDLPAKDAQPPLPPRVPDGSDGLAQPFKDLQPPNAMADTVEALAKSIDPIIEEHGPLFFADERSIHGNQIAIAAKFARDCQICFDPEASAFTGYNTATGVWEPLREPDAKRLLSKFVKRQAEENNAREFLPKRTNAFLGGVLAMLKGFTLAVDKERLRRIIHVANGMLDLSVTPPVLQAHDPSFLSRSLCAIQFRPEAKCPRFLDGLLGAALPPEDIDLLQRFLGAVLLGGNVAQRFLIIYGGAARGKSTLVTLIERIIGLDNVAHFRADHLGSRFETHAFLHKTLLTAKDVPGDYLAHAGAQMIKALVGDDLIQAEMKYGGKFRLHGNFNLIVTSNNRLRLAVEEDEPAWRRRVIIIRFEGSPPEKRIANFAEVLLREEAEGILAWMVAGASMHLKKLDEVGDFKLSDGQKARIDDLLQESKSPAVFVESRITKEKDADLTVDELTHAYLDFCRARGWEALSARQFENEAVGLMQKFHGVLRRNDITRNHKSARGFKHVALKPEDGQ
jgi:putative DNA primase/helicase